MFSRRWPMFDARRCVVLCWLLLAGPCLAAGVTVDDDRGRRLSLPAAPIRIVSLLPSLSESVCALGACERLVGVDRFSNWPARLLALPQLGGLDDAQIERIVALKPDVVLAAPAARVIDRLESLGVTVLVLESRNHADVQRTLTTLGHLLERPEAAARLWARIGQQTDAAAQRVPQRLRGERVYYEIDATPYAAGAGSFIGETLARLGMANAIAPGLGPFPKLNPEYVLRARPDIVMATQRDLDEMPSRPGWAGLKALRQRQTCGFDAESAELLIRPGPRMGEAAGVLADCLVEIGKRGE